MGALGCALPLPSQGWTALVDFGAASRPVAGAARSWNQIDPASQHNAVPLVDTTGAGARGASITVDAVTPFVGANTAGPVAATAGSALAARAYPSDAISDVCYGSDARPRVDVVLSGLDPGRGYDLIAFGSRMNVGDARDTRYTARGFQAVSADLAVSNNTTDVQTLAGVLPDANGTIVFSVEKAPTNTNPNGYFYLNTLEIVERPGTPAPALGFDIARLEVERTAVAAPFLAQARLQTSNLAAPIIQLAATTPSGSSPTWLATPTVAGVATPVPLTFDATGLATGRYEAVLRATAPGFAPTVLRLALEVPTPGSLHVLQYGNSYTIQNGGLPRLLEGLAQEFGLPPVRVTARLQGGRTLNYHRFDPGHAAAITTALPLGAQWDYVVMQGHSLQTTAALGNRTEFLDDALGIHANVRAHSPGARAILFQTWARGQGHSFYPNTFASPAAMHHEVRRAYAQAVANSIQAFGPDSARRAAVGDAVALTGWDPALYQTDLSHPQPSLTLLEAMVIHSAIHGAQFCGSQPDFAGGSALATLLTAMGLGPVEWQAMARLADRVAAPALRAAPGASDDLVLETLVNGSPTACGRGSLHTGDTLSWRLQSPGQAGLGSYSVVGVDVRPVGSPQPSIPGLPSIWLEPQAALALDAGLLPNAGAVGQVTVPASLLGHRALVQGIAVAPSAVTGEALTASDGHVLVFR